MDSNFGSRPQQKAILYTTPYASAPPAEQISGLFSSTETQLSLLLIIFSAHDCHILW